MSAPHYNANKFPDIRNAATDVQPETTVSCLIADLKTRVHRELTALGPFEPSPHIAVAVSGGSDSISLALLANNFVQTRGGRVTTITVDHRLRSESQAEATQVATWMQSHNIAHITLSPTHTDAGNNLLSAARTWRYDALAEWCSTQNVLHCLIGHHANDQQETIALHHARGITEDGTSGMRRVRNYRGIRFLRPLLAIKKNELQHYLLATGTPWIEDPTNRDIRFARARMRQELMSAELLPPCSDRSRREQRVAEAAVDCVLLDPSGWATLDLEIWRSLPTSIAMQLLADIVRTIGESPARPRKHKTLALAAVLAENSNIKRTLGGCLIASNGIEARITRETHAVSCPFTPAKPLAASPFW